MFAILRASKLKTKSQISGSGSHTYRDIPPLNADPKLTRLNQHGPRGHAGMIMNGQTGQNGQRNTDTGPQAEHSSS
jgi:hypothetical protein